MHSKPDNQASFEDQIYNLISFNLYRRTMCNQEVNISPALETYISRFIFNLDFN